MGLLWCGRESVEVINGHQMVIPVLRIKPYNVAVFFIEVFNIFCVFLCVFLNRMTVSL